MDPDDSFSPPLDGLARGNKLNQILTALSSSDLFDRTEYVSESENEDGAIVAGLILPDEPEDIIENENPIGVLMCQWWHMRREQDWWKYEYVEVNVNDQPEGENHSDEERDDESQDPVFATGWCREPNDMVDGMTYKYKIKDGTSDVDTFDPPFEAPKPLTNAVIETYLPEIIEDKQSE